MARKPRIHCPGALYHVMLQGNGGGNVFVDDRDRRFFDDLIAEGVGRFGHRIHAYCWMRNGAYLAIQVADIPLSKIIQNLAFRYTRAFNQRHARSGHLFQGRHKAILVDADAYLLELVRYIHLTPVRVGIVENPRSYPWSGHLAYVSGLQVGWLSTEWVLSRLAQEKALARSQYEQYVLAGIKEGYRHDFHSGCEGGRLLGDDRFVERTLTTQSERQSRKVELNQVVQIVCKEFRLEPAAVIRHGKNHRAAEIRKWVAFLYVESGGTLAEAARYFHRDITTLSRQLQPLVGAGGDSSVPPGLRNAATRLGLDWRIHA